ncbi:hypothetical protein [Roseicella aerolata]|uniref:Uncharacterized protein n=1 Tax=Roseicella aerolata TaxID=2883479 RepID=A0A9X1I9M9_9PROT|nr:hypothetical protein [Roseicella aerolata]MCB4820246.1 hypothetical protein [Roseicella aerolata]
MSGAESLANRLLCGAIQERERGGTSTWRSPLPPFFLGLSVLLMVNLGVDHEARREGFDELKAGARLGA